MDLATLCLSFLTFINQHGGYEPVQECPPVKTTTEQTLQEIACNGAACPALAYYDREQKMIYLSDQLDLEQITLRSILVHELVHYIQDVSNDWDQHENECRSGMSRELHAFRMQEMFLLSHNIHLPVSRNMAYYRC